MFVGGLSWQTSPGTLRGSQPDSGGARSSRAALRGGPESYSLSRGVYPWKYSLRLTYRSKFGNQLIIRVDGDAAVRRVCSVDETRDRPVRENP